jgi:biopolymer transport protein ExbB
MYPLLLGSLLGVGVILERFIAVRKATAGTRQRIGAILRALEADGVGAARARAREIGGPTGRILHSGLARSPEGAGRVEKALEAAGSIEIAFLQRGLIWLSTVANVTPLLGFLGTVSGMIHAFATIAGADQISARLVAGGIEEALITTEAGLSIAIPVQAFHNYFVGRIDRFMTEIEEGSLDLIALIERGQT